MEINVTKMAIFVLVMMIMVSKMMVVLIMDSKNVYLLIHINKETYVPSMCQSPIFLN